MSDQKRGGGVQGTPKKVIRGISGENRVPVPARVTGGPAEF